ncbi:MAG: RNA polymerase sigma factor [Deltaproteobacteria bacterium]|nr:RNA polymerase sigma factor [Deltaproteobacteria bacterium]
MSFLSDKHLVKSCAGGNRRHCRLIYERYKKFVYSLAWKYFKDVETAEDFTHETFLKVFKNIETFRHDSSFKTWLARITVNLCISHLRAMKSRKADNHFSIDNPDENRNKKNIEKNRTYDPHDLLLQKEKNEQVLLAVDELKPEDKTTILLWSEGFTYAETTKTNPKTVGTRIYHTKIKLTKKLTPYMKKD